MLVAPALSNELAALITRNADLSWQTREWISVGVGLCTLLVGYGLENYFYKPGELRSEDFAFWCYLFGLMGFWIGLTSMDSGSELRRLVYLAINLGLMALAIKLRRTVFMVFGVLGVYAYLGHLAWTVFKDSVLFPFVLALLGLSLILGTVFGQHYLRRRLKAPA